MPGPVRRRVIRTAVIALLFGIAAGCSDESPAPIAGTDTAVTHYGPARSLGSGTARSYVTVRRGEPVEFGVALSPDAVAALPAAGEDEATEFLLALPDANPTPFRMIELDWSTAGHPPFPVSRRPHLDARFYVIDAAGRDAISATDPNYALKAARLPAAARIPAGYVAPFPDATPRVGVRWVDPTTPEVTRKGFGASLLLGSWDGEVTFWEPVVTLDLLAARTTVDRPLRAPTAVAVPGWYPTAWRVHWDGTRREHRIAVGGFVALQ